MLKTKRCLIKYNFIHNTKFFFAKKPHSGFEKDFANKKYSFLFQDETFI